MNILITGGAGFIGSNIVETLVRQGEVVRVLDNCSTGRLHNLDSCIKSIEFIQGDIRDLAQVREAMQGIDTCCIRRLCPRWIGRLMTP